MPRRNLYLLIAVGLISVICYHRVQKSRYSQTLVDAFEMVQRRYYEPVDGRKLFAGALEGMMDRLDENSRYLGPEVLREFEETINQRFTGVGMEVTVDPKTRQLMVISPLVGSPAYEAGIRAGDRVMAIDGQSTQGSSLGDLVKRLRGEPGERVTVTVIHEGETQPTDIRIVRAVIRLDTILGDTRQADGTWDFFLPGHDRIGYLRITSFAEQTDQDLSAALVWLTDRKVRGLILDLRNNPGGMLDTAVAVCNMFLPAGLIVTTRGQGRQIRRVYDADGRAPYAKLPLAVIVNRYSASASEIVAGCFQDHRRAVIVGQRTFGKGTVQELISLGKDQGALKLTTSSYWRPSGGNIHRGPEDDDRDAWGVLPDKGFEVAVDAQQFARWLRWRHQRDSRRPPGADATHDEGQAKPFVDLPVEKAAEYLEQQ